MTSAQTTHLDQLDTRIRSVWGRGVKLHLIAGLLVFLRWAIPLFLIGVFIDWMTYMPTPGRVVILITLLTVSCYRAWRGGWRARPSCGQGGTHDRPARDAAQARCSR